MPHQSDVLLLASIKHLAGAIYGTLNGRRAWFVYDNPVENQEVGIGIQGISPTITCRTLDVEDIEQGDTVSFTHRGKEVQMSVLMHRNDGTGLSHLDLRYT